MYLKLSLVFVHHDPRYNIIIYPPIKEINHKHQSYKFITWMSCSKAHDDSYHYCLDYCAYLFFAVELRIHQTSLRFECQVSSPQMFPQTTHYQRPPIGLSEQIKIFHIQIKCEIFIDKIFECLL